MNITTSQTNEITADLAGFQASLAERRLARDSQIPHFLRWVQRFLWHWHGQQQGFSSNAVLRVPACLGEGDLAATVAPDPFEW